MLDFLAYPIKEILGASARRMGTFFSAFLIANDVPTELVGQFIVACGVLLGLSFDVVLAFFYRQRLKIATKRLVEASALVPSSPQFRADPSLPDPPTDPALYAQRQRPL